MSVDTQPPPPPAKAPQELLLGAANAELAPPSARPPARERQRARMPSAVRRISLGPPNARVRAVLPEVRVITLVAGPLARRIELADLAEMSAHVVLEPDVEKATTLACRELGIGGFIVAHNCEALADLYYLVGKVRAGPSALPGLAIGVNALDESDSFHLGLASARAEHPHHVLECIMQFAADAHAQTTGWLRACDKLASMMNLSPREAEVAYRMALGHSGNEALARSMGVGKATVIALRKRMEAKLGLKWSNGFNQIITGKDEREAEFTSGSFDTV